MSSPMSPPILSDQLECAICIDQLWEPKLLNCGHTFCLKCLEELFDPDENPLNPVVACPVCRKKTPIPTNSKGIPGLNTNFALQSLLEALSPLKPVTSSRDLTVKEDGEATVCDIHKEVRKFYCCTCETLICRDCTVVDHPRPEHQCMNLDEAYNWRCQLNQKQLQLSARVVKLAKKSATILEAAKANLNERCNQVITEIEACRDAGLYALDEKIEAIEVFQTDVAAEITVLRELTQDASKTGVLDQSKSLIEGMASVRSQQNDVLNNPEPVQYPQFMGTSEAIKGWPHLTNLEGSSQPRQRKPRPKQPKDASAGSSGGQEALNAPALSLMGEFPRMGLGLGNFDQSQQGHYRGGHQGGRGGQQGGRGGQQGGGGGGSGRGGRGGGRGGRGYYHKGRGGNRGRGGDVGTSN